MKGKIISAIIALALVGLAALGYWSASQHRHGEAPAELDPKEIIYEHLGDEYGWALPFNHSLRIPLPIIVWADDGFHCFMSSRLADGATYEGLRISTSEDHNGKVVQMMPDGSEKRPWDFSVTKNVAAIFIAALLVVWMVMSLRRWYARQGMKAPRRAMGLLELVVDYVYTDTIRPIMGKEAPKYAPYLLTAFFFILTMNLLGLIVIFPGGDAQTVREGPGGAPEEVRPVNIPHGPEYEGQVLGGGDGLVRGELGGGDAVGEPLAVGVADVGTGPVGHVGKGHGLG